MREDNPSLVRIGLYRFPTHTDFVILCIETRHYTTHLYFVKGAIIKLSLMFDDCSCKHSQHLKKVSVFTNGSVSHEALGDGKIITDL